MLVHVVVLGDVARLIQHVAEGPTDGYTIHLQY
jgi:hypothetical protein